MAKVFFSYSHADEALRDELEKQLAILKRQKIIEVWHDRRLSAGDEFDQVISDHIQNDDIILLLVSPDFLNSDYCYDKEMEMAMTRHNKGDATVIPVILRCCDWKSTSFGKLLATPPDGRAVSSWADKDEAFFEVAKAIRKAAGKYSIAFSENNQDTDYSLDSESISIHKSQFDNSGLKPRTSNLRLRKEFTEQDKDSFRVDFFDYLGEFFKNSLNELKLRHAEIDFKIRSIDANKFTVCVYRNGKDVASCTIFIDGHVFAKNGVFYSAGEQSSSNSYNESLTVEFDDQFLFLKRGMSFDHTDLFPKFLPIGSRVFGIMNAS